jgi:hypothetical protein
MANLLQISEEVIAQSLCAMAPPTEQEQEQANDSDSSEYSDTGVIDMDSAIAQVKQWSSTSSAPPPTPLRLLCVTLGGPRQERMKILFESNPDFHLTFISGIQQRQLRSRKGLIDALRAVNILDSSNPDPVKEEECWRAMRHLNRDRGVLACTLAHIKAMALCAKGDYDAIVEDNICGPISIGISANRMRSMIAATPSADARYFAYSGRGTEIVQWQQELLLSNAQQQQTFAGWPTTTLPDEGKKVSILWGTLAYKTSDRAYQTIMREIQMDLPGSLAFQLKRAKNHTAKPIDKIIPRFLTKNNYNIAVIVQPAFFRAPVRSKIHPNLDEKFIETTDQQLSLCGLTWNQLDLSKEELALFNVRKEGKEANKAEEEKETGVGDKETTLSATSGTSGTSGAVKKKIEWFGNNKDNGWTGKQQEKKQRQVPTVPVPVVCAQCGIQYSSKNALFKHLREDSNGCQMET